MMISRKNILLRCERASVNSPVQPCVPRGLSSSAASDNSLLAKIKRPAAQVCSGLLTILLIATAIAVAQPTHNPGAQPATSTNALPLDKLLDHVSQRVSDFLDLFSNVKCVEQVKQEKVRPDGKVQLSEQSSYDYLVIMTNAGGDLSLDESRLPLKVAKADQKKDISMLTSNGFATLFLVFHPY